jgi:uncharacterized membrane protein
MRKYFIAGLIVLLPLAITYWIIKLIVNLITTPFEEFVTAILLRFDLFTDGINILSHAQVISLLTKILILVSLVTFILLIGFIARWFLFRSIFHLADHALRKIPFVSKVYLACKDFTTALFSPKSDSFSQVVLVPFPSSSHYSIGLITSEFENQFLEGDDDQLVSVLIPGTPNPTIGFLLMFAKRSIRKTDVTVEQAIRFIMSAGSVLPEGMKSIPLIK